MEEEQEVRHHGEWWLPRIARAVGVILGVLMFAVASHAHAASLYLSPTSGSYAPGDTFSVGVYVSSTDQAMNAVSGTISYPPSMIEVTSASASGSIINLWSQQPSFSNGSGTVTFEGIVLNPGYSGSSGKIATITFTAKAAGTASVAFTRGSVLANDGLGTDVTSGLGRASFTVSEGDATAPSSTAPPASTAPTSVPAAPTVTSSTHPDAAKWYANANPTFSWSLPSGATGINVLADRNTTTDPGSTSDGLRSSYTYTDVDDGVWYFHVKVQNSLGWGKTSHVAFRIDTVAPTVTATVETDGEAQAIVVNGADALSGIDHYGFTFGDQAEVLWTDDGTHRYSVPALVKGEYPTTVTAYDAAGNTATATVTVMGFAEEPVPETVAPVQTTGTEQAPTFAWTTVAGYGVLGLIFLVAIAMFGWLVWRGFRQASQYKLVLVKREPKKKDPYRHARRKMARLLEHVAKKADRRRRKGLVGKGKRMRDAELDSFVDDVIETARKLRG
jgi:hypothetical protein